MIGQGGFKFESITKIVDEKSRSITAENPGKEVGAGGQAASNLGPERKGCPCIRDMEPGETETLARSTGPASSDTSG